MLGLSVVKRLTDFEQSRPKKEITPMKNLLRIIPIIVLLFTFTACGSNNDNDEMDDEEVSEEVTQGMENFWMEQREEFISLAEALLDSWEERIEENADSETAEELKADIDRINDELSELEQAEKSDWEEMREEIAGMINDLREKADYLE